MWIKVTEEHKKIKKVFYARNDYEYHNFFIKYNEEYDCWCLEKEPHILIAVKEIWKDIE